MTSTLSKFLLLFAFPMVLVSGMADVYGQQCRLVDRSALKSDEKICTVESVTDSERKLDTEIGSTPDSRIREIAEMARKDKSNIVVIAGPSTYEDPDPGVLQVRKIGMDSFEMRYREFNYRRRKHGDSTHYQERAAHVVVERGRHSLKDGSTWEAGTFRIDGTGKWHRQQFRQNFPERPKLFLTLQTARGPHVATVRAKDVDQAGFQASLFEEEALNDGHRPELVGYLAIHSPSQGGDAYVISERDTVRYSVTTVTTDETPVPVGDSFLSLQEETSGDDETDHRREKIDVLILGETVIAQIVTAHGRDTVVLRRGAPPGFSDEPARYRDFGDQEKLKGASSFGRESSDQDRREGAIVTHGEFHLKDGSWHDVPVPPH